MKRCGKCGVEKPHSDFYRRALARDGLQSHCRQCQNAAKSAWNKANPEKANGHSQRHREKVRSEKSQLRAETKARRLEEQTKAAQARAEARAAARAEAIEAARRKTTKQCRVCQIEKPIESFYRQTKARDGRQSSCKECSNQNSIEWAKRNRDKVNVIRKNWLSKNPDYMREWNQANPEKVRQGQEKYRKANPERVRKTWSDYHERNREKRLRQSSEWAKANPELNRSRVRRRDAKRRENETFVVTKRDLARILSQKCAGCGIKENTTLDHIVPISRGGRHSVGNLHALCGSCNSSKKDKLWIEWRRATGRLAAKRND